jgi:hypothetical protein
VKKLQHVSKAEGGSLSDLGAILKEQVQPAGPTQLARFTVATVPSAAANTGAIIYVSNGAAGSPVVAFSDGTNWKRVDTLANIS